MNTRSKVNLQDLAGRLVSLPWRPRVLVVGGSSLGEGLDQIIDREIDFLETDVMFGPRCTVVCDAHSLPFAASSFDAVIAQAVLEHVVDPYECVREFHRVLRPNGLIYAETPFMQQVHAGRYDFTRFTHLGHRRLFRDFDELLHEVGAGPGTALAWSYEYLLLSFFERPKARLAVKAFARVTGSWMKYLDAVLVGRRGSLDAASAYFFMGVKSDFPIDDRELIRSYRGAQ